MCEAVESTYQCEWNSLFHTKYYLENLRSFAIKGKLRNSHFRSICWKLLLECLPEDPKSWIESTKLWRKGYDEILDKCHVNPRKLEQSMDISVNNPLSQSIQSPWNQYFQDSELKLIIQQDVVRTFPEVEFFHSQRIQDMMTSILFSYAREYPYISYKQGMHELLAPIIFVLHYDQQEFLEVSKSDNLDLDLHIILNQNSIEHDSFYLFCSLMEFVETWYTMSESPFSRSLVSAEPFTEDASSPTSSLGLKLKNIYKNLLKHHDTELFLYLEQMEITPQIYGIRWLRLLFGREFPIHDLLVIWDTIFADGISSNLVDYIFIAMLIAIRELLLKSDYASCLHHLMHYPNITDVQYIIDLALHLRDPSIVKPEICLIQVHDQSSKHMKENKPIIVKSVFSKTPNSSKPKSSSLTKTIDTRPKSLKIAGLNCVKHIPDAELGMEEHSKDFNFDTQGNYNTFPRTSIRNVMENKNIIFRPLDVSQNFSHAEDKGATGKILMCKELVPLVPASKNCSSDNVSKKFVDKKIREEQNESIIIALRNQISEMKLMNDYCSKQITQQISKLQECMVGQSLIHEDEMFIALAGLKRARDILKGTVTFTESVINDDYINKQTTYFGKQSTKPNVTCDMENFIDHRVLRSNDRCDIKHSNASIEQAAQVTLAVSNKNCDKFLNPMNHDKSYLLNNSVSKEEHSDNQS